MGEDAVDEELHRSIEPPVSVTSADVIRRARRTIVTAVLHFGLDYENSFAFEFLHFDVDRIPIRFSSSLILSRSLPDPPK